MEEKNNNTGNQPMDLRQYSIRVLVTVGIVSFFGILLYIVQHVIYVLFIGFTGILFAVFLEGVASFLTRYIKMPYKLTLIFVVLLFIGFFVGVGFITGPQISDQFDQLERIIPKAIESLKETLREYEITKSFIESTPSPESLIPSASGILGQITGFFSTAFGILIYFMVIFFIGVYLAINPNMYIKNLINLVPIDKRERFYEVARSMGTALRWWIVARVVAMLVIGFLVWFGFLIAGVPLALTLGFITALLSFIPYIGPVLAFVPALMVALIHGPTMVLIVSIVYLSVQLLESYVITPNIEQRAVSLPPALLIIMQILMGVMLGILGILVATPATVVIIVLIQSLYIKDILGDNIEVIGSSNSKKKK